MHDINGGNMMTTAKPAGIENMLHVLMYTTITNKLQSAANTDLDTNMQTYTHNHAHSVGIETHTHTHTHTVKSGVLKQHT